MGACPAPGVCCSPTTSERIPNPRKIGPTTQVASDRAFFSLVRAAFSSRRKMLRNNLRPHNSVEEVEAALLKIGLPATARPQELSLAEFVALYAELGAPWDAEVAAPKRVRLSRQREEAGEGYAAGAGDEEDGEGEAGEASGEEDDEEEEEDAAGGGAAAAAAAGAATPAGGKGAVGPPPRANAGGGGNESR